MSTLTRLLALTATATFAAFSTTAQEHDFSSVSINGLDTYKIYTREQITDALGEPDEEDTLSDAKAVRNVVDELGYSDVGKDSIKICVFTLYSDRFAVNDYVRVGDPVSKVYDMGGKTLEEEDRSRIYWAPEGSPDEPWIEWDCYPAFYYDENGIITEIELYYD